MALTVGELRKLLVDVQDDRKVLVDGLPVGWVVRVRKRFSLESVRNGNCLGGRVLFSSVRASDLAARRPDSPPSERRQCKADSEPDTGKQAPRDM
jgi:hypothetical protein